jgi:hypothetical protein
MFVLPRVLALLVVAAVSVARADETSSTPYAALYKVLEPAQKMARYDRLRAVQRIQSKLPTVSASQIRIAIKAARGDIAVPIAADGRIEFPFDGALQSENPSVQTNQPKGSLSLTVTMELKLPPGERIAWRDLDAALQQARAMLDEQGRERGGAVPAVGGAEFRFAPGSDARVTLAGRSERLLVADAEGRVIVMLDETTLKEQPDLLLNVRPNEILPFLSADTTK